jgi:hypothetical protein
MFKHRNLKMDHVTINSAYNELSSDPNIFSISEKIRVTTWLKCSRYRNFHLIEVSFYAGFTVF